jgi:hypothetical protein
MRRAISSSTSLMMLLVEENPRIYEHFEALAKALPK